MDDTDYDGRRCARVKASHHRMMDIHILCYAGKPHRCVFGVKICGEELDAFNYVWAFHSHFIINSRCVDIYEKHYPHQSTFINRNTRAGSPTHCPGGREKKKKRVIIIDKNGARFDAHHLSLFLRLFEITRKKKYELEMCSASFSLQFSRSVAVCKVTCYLECFASRSWLSFNLLNTLPSLPIYHL